MPPHDNNRRKAIMETIQQIRIKEMELAKIKTAESKINENLRGLHLRLLTLNGQDVVTDNVDVLELLRQLKEIKEDNTSLKQDNNVIKNQLIYLHEKISNKFSVGKVVDRLYDSMLKNRRFGTKKEWSESAGITERSCQSNEKKVEQKLRKNGWKLSTEKNGNSTSVWIEPS